MKPVFLVYKTDVWHSRASQQLIGIATTPAIAIRICKAQAKKDGETIPAEQIEQLQNMKQTQGDGETYTGEFLFEQLDLNTLL